MTLITLMQTNKRSHFEELTFASIHNEKTVAPTESK